MKILTAMANPILNEKLQNIKSISVIGKDIQYKEGVIEILEKYTDIECLIISEMLPGQISFCKLIEKIKNIKSEVDIYVFLENKDENMENYLISKEIYKIYYLNKIDFNNFINNFKQKPKNILKGINKEIDDFKKLILKENNIVDNYSLIEQKVCESFEETEWEKKNVEKGNDKKRDVDNTKIGNFEKCETIAITGNFGVGKTIIASFLSTIISKQNKKTLLIDFDIEGSSINTIFRN